MQNYQRRVLCPFLALLAATVLVSAGPAAPPPKKYSVREAILTEWSRQDLQSRYAQAKLSPAEAARLDLSRRRIGAPGAPALLPPELDKPTLADWEARAGRARTPEERFTALHFLNRLRSAKALSALQGLGPADAKAWPESLHLENLVAAARLRGEAVSPELAAFLQALKDAGKADSVRTAAADLRLVLAGLQPVPNALVAPSPQAVAAVLDAWNRGPWERRVGIHLKLLIDLMFPVPLIPDSERRELWRNLALSDAPDLSAAAGEPEASARRNLRQLIVIRLLEGLPETLDDEALRAVETVWRSFKPAGSSRLLLVSWAAVLARVPAPWGIEGLKTMVGLDDPVVAANVLPALRKVAPAEADALREKLLAGPDSLGLAAGIDDLAAPPANLDALIRRAWDDRDIDALQVLIPALERWKLPVERRKEILRPWLKHPEWTRCFLAWQELTKLDPGTPWPSAPAPSPRDKAILDEAVKLAEKARPVRVKITFSDGRCVVLQLDPGPAPMNVANFLLLAREGFFNGRLVPRVVPDFVVQMGSPFDTMDGGPGYTVRCEDSLTWYGPGTVGMALSGKDTGGSQFFITTNATPHLTGRYTRLGSLEDPVAALPVLDSLVLGTTIQSVTVVK